MLTEVKDEGRGAIAIVHDVQLAEDPELFAGGGAIALLARENPAHPSAHTTAAMPSRSSEMASANITTTAIVRA
jgi:hypothetical protein